MKQSAKLGSRLPKHYKLEIATLNTAWHDKDTVLLHACFQILVDFIEKEKPGDWSHNVEHRKIWKELQSLYTWWKEKRPSRRDIHWEKYMEIFGDTGIKDRQNQLSTLLTKSAKLEAKWEAEDQKNLHRLIEARRFLWT